METPAVMKIEIYDPPMCCSSGVCGIEPDERLSRLAADLDWLRSMGVDVRRYNLAQEPMAFTENVEVQRIVNKTGGKGLPIIIADGRIVSQREYPTRDRLAEFAGLAGDKSLPKAHSDDPAMTPGDECCGGGCCG